MSGDSLKLQVLFAAIDKLTGPLSRMRAGSRGLSADIGKTRAEIRAMGQAQKQINAFRLADAGFRKRTAELEQARAATARYRAEIAATEAPTLKMQKNLDRAIKFEQVLTQKHDQQGAALADLTSKLKAAGIETANLADHEVDLAQKLTQANARLEQQQARAAKLGRARARGERLQQLGGRTALAGGALTASTLPLVGVLRDSARAAIDAEELGSAFNVTFKQSSAVMNRWAIDTGNAMGRSIVEMKKAANTFGIFFNQAAAPEKAAAMSRQFAVLAQDLGSFFNTDTQTAIDKLRSGLSGESEPLRDFGVFLTEAKVKAQALAMGLKPVNGALTEEQKIMARYALILAETKNAQGDVARTSGSTANRIRAAGAAWENLKVVVGERLIPVLTPLIGHLADLIGWFTRLSPGAQRFLVIAGLIVAVLGPVLAIFGSLMTVIGGVAAALSIGFLPAIGVILAVVGVVALLGYAAYKIYQNWGGIKAFFVNLWQGIKGAFAAGIAAIRSVLSVAVSWFKSAGSMMMQGLLMALNPALLVTRLLSVARSGLTAFKNFFGIKSPSRVMMDMGGHMTRGLAIGLDRGGPGPLKSMGRIAGGLGVAAAAGLATPALAGGAGGGRAQAQPVAVTYAVTIKLDGAANPREQAREIKRELDALLAVDARGGYEDV